MSAYQHEHDQMIVVARPQTQARADFIQVTLAAHGLQASVSPAASAYPSVDFVEGVDVRVRAEDEEAARRVLEGLGLLED